MLPSDFCSLWYHITASPLDSKRHFVHFYVFMTQFFPSSLTIAHSHKFFFFFFLKCFKTILKAEEHHRTLWPNKASKLTSEQGAPRRCCSSPPHTNAPCFAISFMHTHTASFQQTFSRLTDICFTLKMNLTRVNDSFSELEDSMTRWFFTKYWKLHENLMKESREVYTWGQTQMDFLYLFAQFYMRAIHTSAWATSESIFTENPLATAL